MGTQRVTGPSNPPLGTGGDQGRRVLLHHVPLAVASVVVLVLFMGLPGFNVSLYPHPDLMTATLPQEGAAGHARPSHDPRVHGGDQRARMHRGVSYTRMMDHRTGDAQSGDHGGHTGSRGHGDGDSGSTDHRDSTGSREYGGGLFLTRWVQQFTVATGYLALGLLALTLLSVPRISYFGDATPSQPTCVVTWAYGPRSLA